VIKDSLLEVVKEDLIKHEGYKDEIYLCSEGIPTFGIGHAVKENDPEYTWPVGTPVEKDRIDSAFLADVQDACNDVDTLFEDAWNKPDNVQRVLVNMAFNIGRTRFGKFKKMIAAVNSNDFEEAANQMVDSVWYNQVGNRSIELENWMRNA
jgi:lysozyme